MYDRYEFVPQSLSRALPVTRWDLLAAPSSSHPLSCGFAAPSQQRLEFQLLFILQEPLHQTPCSLRAVMEARGCGRVPTSQDRNLWTSATVRRPIPVRSRVAARLSAGRRTARCQTRPRTRPVWRFGRRRHALAGGLLQLIGTAFGASTRAARISRGARRAGVRESEAVTKRELERE